MRTYGAQQAARMKAGLSSPVGSDARLGPTYYDLESIFYQMAAYTGDAKWSASAQDAEQGYRPWVEGAAADGGGFGAVPGYWIFSEGLRRDFELTGDTKSRDAVHQLAIHGSYCRDETPLEWSASATLMRENAYCVKAYLDDESLGNPLRTRAAQQLSQLIDNLDATITGRYKAEQDADVPDICKGKTYAQPFYIGLAARTLIAWHTTHPDPRIPAILARTADFMWDKLRYNQTNGRFWYGQCTTSATGTWNVWTSAGGNLPADDLNLLIAPLYAWLYRQTGNDTYRERGDAIWSVGVIDATQNGLNSKQFNQNYMWSFDYIGWRR